VPWSTTTSRPTCAAAARHCILDWYGCAIAGQDEPLAVILRDELLDGRGGPCRIVGRDATAPLLDAALINGAAVTHSTSTTPT
jgi:2-methylcitrate dehydratase PrpD